MFNVCASEKYSPCARCVHAANVVGKYVDIFQLNAVYLKHTLYSLILGFRKTPCF
jgi:hypothetical protein